MVNYKKFFAVFFFTSLIVLFPTTFCVGADRQLEVKIPGLNQTTLPVLPEYIKAIFNFSLMAVGIVVFVAILYGGFRYLTSAGNPTAMADAKDQIFSALLGLIILFSSWLILKTINPELIQLGEPGSGLATCTCDSNNVCTCPPNQVCNEDKFCSFLHDASITIYQDINYGGRSLEMKASVTDPPSDNGFVFENNITSIKINKPGYVAVIFEHQNYLGKSLVIDSDIPYLDYGFNDITSSIMIIKKAFNPGYVTLCSDINFCSYNPCPGPCTEPFLFHTSHPDFTQLPCGESETFNDKVVSIEVPTGFVAILYEHINFRGYSFPVIGKGEFTDLRSPTVPLTYIPAYSSSIQVINGTKVIEQ